MEEPMQKTVITCLLVLTFPIFVVAGLLFFISAPFMGLYIKAIDETFRDHVAGP
jgi:hypothetical protein